MRFIIVFVLWWRCLKIIVLAAVPRSLPEAALAQLGERETEDLEVLGSIPRGGIIAVPELYDRRRSVRRVELH